MEDNYSPRDYGNETGLSWLCNYLYSGQVEFYGSFELIKENYFAIDLSERYGDIKRATTKKCSTLRFLTPAIKGPCNVICCKTGSNVGGKTRNIFFELVLQQC